MCSQLQPCRRLEDFMMATPKDSLVVIVCLANSSLVRIWSQTSLNMSNIVQCGRVWLLGDLSLASAG
jgi:hypothetical protein